MRSSIGLVMVALTVGCATEALDSSETDQAVGIKGGVGTCPDPMNCTLNNGGGVYTEELGNIGLGTNNYMIARFVNNPAGGVAIEGRGYNPSSGNYYGHSATLLGARWNGGAYAVASISESLTTPTITLHGPGGPVVLTGSQVEGLQLVLEVDDGRWTLTFTQSLAPDRGYDNATLQEFHAVWNPGEVYNSSTAQEYCTRAPVANQATEFDSVVFQQAIAVNPITAVMERADNAVTLSCRYGAIATARWWGYSYRGDQTSADLFESAMHMKRASYCGDDTFYTRAHTQILVQDTSGIQTSQLGSTEFEASWGRASPGSPIRAQCVSKRIWRRRPGVNFPPDPNGLQFDGDCLDPATGAVLFTILPCDPGAFGTLADEAVDPPLAP